MEATTGLGRFQQFLQQPAVRRAGRQCIIRTGHGDEQTLAVARPRNPPGFWGRLIGSALYARLFGGPGFRQARMQEQRETLAEFKAGMQEKYGLTVARVATRSLGSRCLGVGQARQALRRAEEARSQLAANCETFDAMLRFRLRDQAVAKAGRATADPAPVTTAARLTWPPTRELTHLLAEVTLGDAAARGPLQTTQARPAVSEALKLLRTLRATPGMTDARAIELLKFAARVPGDRMAAARDLLRPSAERTQFDSRGVAAGADLGPQLVPAGFAPHASSRLRLVDGRVQLDPEHASPRHAPLMQNLTTADLHAVSLQFERPQYLHEGTIKDKGRASFVVQGTTLPRDKPDDFHLRWRALFPPGLQGDALATAASTCAHQFNVHPVTVLAANETLHPVAKQDHHTLHEVWQRPDGLWAVRSTQRTEFSMAGLDRDGQTLMQPMEPGSAILHTLEFVIDPDHEGSSLPMIRSVESDVVFTGRPAAAQAS